MNLNNDKRAFLVNTVDHILVACSPFPIWGYQLSSLSYHITFVIVENNVVYVH